MAETLTGTVEHVELRRFVDGYAAVKKWRPRGDTHEDYVYKLRVRLRLEDGRSVDFWTPGAEFVVNCPVGCPVAVWHFEPNAWIVSDAAPNEHGRHSGTDSKDPAIRAAVAAGDRITVRGTRKDGRLIRAKLVV